MAKDFFKANNVEFTDYDVSNDQAKRDEVIERSGQMGVPVIFIGEDMVIGYDEARIKSLLGL
ncbi:MAG: glutaredoxin 3 [Patescibacteria group bacterium]|jgi:glutaredoxin|nr:glutaredoxin 3 [Patescibacteria group bacterium]